MGEFLYQPHILNEVDISLVGQNQFAAFHLIGRIFQNVQITTESEVLLVVRQKVDMDARVTVHLHGILYIITIERYGTAGNGRRERMLQDTHLIIIDVDIGKDILRHRVQYITGLEEIIDTR